VEKGGVMNNKSTFFILAALFVLGSLTYSIKQKVIGLDDELSKVHRTITQYQESMHILQADWYYLTRPDRLQALVDQHTPLQQADGVSLVSFDDVLSDKYALSPKEQEDDESMRLASLKEAAE
jgi:hypothetical protein